MPVAFASARNGWGAAASPAPAAPAATNTTPTPADNGGQIAVPSTQPEGATSPAAGQPLRTFASQAELDDFVKGAKSQAERAAIRKLAKDLGFEDAEEMRQTLQSLRQGQGGGGEPSNTPETTATTTNAEGPNASARLAMAVKVGAELNLPVALINRLQGDTEEAMRADAQALLALVGSGGGNRGPGIPPVPAGNSPVTFTRTQLQDAKFVRDNAAAIRQAAAQGRIVNS